MRRDWLIIGCGAVALALGPGARAVAAESSKGIEDPARVGRPGEGTGTQRASASRGERELSGKVVKADGKTLYLEHMGAIVPLKLDEETEFSGASSGRDLAEGEEVRASFTVEGKTTNVAKRITVARRGTDASSGAGSAGTRDTPGEVEPLPGRPPVPPDAAPPMPPDRQPIPGDPGIPTPSDPGGPPVKY